MLPPNQVLSSLAAFSPVRETYPADIKRAAVCLVLQPCDEGLSLLMIKRAVYDGDPWSGHMAFPGGRVEADDASPLAAAMRECEEEVGLNLQQQARLVTSLTEVRATLRGRQLDMIVSPYVFMAEQGLALRPNYEVAKIVSIPLSLFFNANARASFDMEFEGTTSSRPCYYYEGHKVWGLSLLFIDELVRIVTR